MFQRVSRFMRLWEEEGTSSSWQCTSFVLETAENDAVSERRATFCRRLEELTCELDAKDVKANWISC